MSQGLMKAYGVALTPPADNARNNIAGFLAGMGAQYLGLPADSLLPVVTVGLEIAMDICASDFEREIKASTGWVNGKLSFNGIFW
jgi:hypothetical protein